MPLFLPVLMQLECFSTCHQVVVESLPNHLGHEEEGNDGLKTEIFFSLQSLRFELEK